MKSYYQVIVKDGERVDSLLRVLAPAVRDSCGHQHKTRSAAEQCKTRLLHSRREHGSTVCSAHWYNARVIKLTADGYYDRTEGHTDW